MSLRQATLSGTMPGRSLKTLRPAWFSGGQSIIVTEYMGYTSVTTPSTANTKSSWVQAFSSTAADTGLLYLTVTGTQGYGSENSILMDIGVGAAGSETVIAQNIAVSGYLYTGSFSFPIPLFIAQGSRVAWRVQHGLASKTIAGIMNFGFAKTPDAAVTPRSVDTIGANTSTSRGTALAGASGTYTEITSATNQPYQALMVVPSNATTSGTAGAFRLTLASGASGSEVAIGTTDFQQNASGNVYPLQNQNFPMALVSRHIPAGTRLSVAHNMSSGPGNVQVVIIGVPYR
jgi:hypothetical protein